MASIDESGLVGQIRDRPISPKLHAVLLAAAEDADVDVLHVASGGQPGSSGRSTGSHRHDDGNAADLDLVVKGRTLKFTDAGDLDTFMRFVTAAAAHGANGIGAGVGYMGPTRIHVGFGNTPSDTKNVVWGAGGATANAPSWLRQAAAAGWAHPAKPGAEVPDEPAAVHPAVEVTMESDSQVERFRPMLDFIAVHEGTANRPDDGYNTSLGYGRYLPGRVEQNLVSKTLDEIFEIGLGMRKQPGNPNSSALGRYQIVGKTMRGLQSKRGLPGSTLFSPQTQDRFCVDLILECGRNAQRFGSTWASLKSVSPDKIYAAYDKDGTTMKPIPSQPIVNIPPDLWTAVAEWLRSSASASSTAPSDTDGDWPALRLRDSGDGVERLQNLLNELKYYNGGADGKFGTLTRDALAAFQLDNGLPATGVADANTWRALTKASSRDMPDQRAGLTAADLRNLGSKTIKNADLVRYAGWLTGLLGVGGLSKGGGCALSPTSSICAGGSIAPTAATQSPNVASLDSLGPTLQALRDILAKSTDPNLSHVGQVLDSMQQPLQQALQAAKPAIQNAVSAVPWDSIPALVGGLVPGPTGSLLALGLGVAFHIFGSNITQRRVQDQRDGKHVGSATAS